MIPHSPVPTPSHSPRPRVSIVGAAGYAGAEAVALLLAHPGVELASLHGSARHSERPQPFSDLFPRFRGLTGLAVEGGAIEDLLAVRPDAVMLATPHEASHDLAPLLLEQGITVLDLSAAFRLRDKNAYPRHYGFEHRHPQLLASAVYGLPELNRVAIATSMLIALPGCYPTSVVLPLAPLMRAGLLAHAPVIVDSTSGVSGAGRTPALKSMLCEVSQQPYAVFSHRHQPEMAQESECDIIFTPHLGPFDRGILSTIHATLSEGVTAAEVRDVLLEQYSNEPFVRLLDAGHWPSVSAVERTNFCDIALAVDEARRHLILSSAVDNLLKGAAGQAVQCLNIRLGLPEWLGLGARNVSKTLEACAR